MILIETFRKKVKERKINWEISVSHDGSLRNTDNVQKGYKKLRRSIICQMYDGYGAGDGDDNESDLFYYTAKVFSKVLRAPVYASRIRACLVFVYANNANGLIQH